MKKFTTLIVAFIFLTVALACFVFMQVRISGFVATLAEARESSFSTEARDQALRRADALIAQTASSNAELAGFVVPDSNSVRIIEAIENTAKRERVTATIGSVSVMPASWTYHEPVRVTFSVRGSLAAITRFASLLETLPEASRLVSASFEVSDNNAWFATFVVDFIKEKNPAL